MSHFQQQQQPVFAGYAVPVNNTNPPPATAPAADFSSGYLPPHTVQNDGNLKEFLNGKGWPESMQTAFIRNIDSIPLRFFICDDSGSMSTDDGTVIIDYKGNMRASKCSRWKELTTSLQFHADVALYGSIPTEFRFLNAGGPFEIGFSPSQPITNYNSLKSILADGSPGGGTPLCRHIREVTQKIQFMASSLVSAGKKAVIVIATDGEASDGDVRAALAPLKQLPVWVVLRLCTDEENIINSWNKIDDELELNMDVIDDFFGESEEIHAVNPWLTYGEPMHRMREFGVTLKELDNIDEKLLPVEEMLKICKICLGPVVDSMPPPQVDMKAFLRELDNANSLVPKVWSSITQKKEFWIHSKDVKKCYGGGGGCVIC